MRRFGSIPLLTGLALGQALGQAEEQHTIVEPTITAKARAHWAWQPLGQAVVPQVPQAKHLANPIDHFIAARLQPHALSQAPEADRRTLIRRLHFDLLGLPPSAEAVAAFEANPRPDAYERLLDSLLASPAYGERWAQHWLDLARFAEADGIEPALHYLQRGHFLRHKQHPFALPQGLRHEVGDGLRFASTGRPLDDHVAAVLYVENRRQLRAIGIDHLMRFLRRQMIVEQGFILICRARFIKSIGQHGLQ